jgi:hypothetical protein
MEIAKNTDLLTTEEDLLDEDALFLQEQEEPEDEVPPPEGEQEGQVIGNPFRINDRALCKKVFANPGEKVGCRVWFNNRWLLPGESYQKVSRF